MAGTCRSPTNLGWKPKKAVSCPQRVGHQGGEGGQQPHMATCRLFLFRIQTASRPPQGMKDQMLPIGGHPFKDSPPCSVQSSKKGLMLKWSLSPAPEKNMPESILQAIFSLQFSGEFQIWLIFSWFWIWALSSFQRQNISMSTKTTPSSAASTTWALLQMICSLCYQNHH